MQQSKPMSQNKLVHAQSDKNIHTTQVIVNGALSFPEALLVVVNPLLVLLQTHSFTCHICEWLLLPRGPGINYQVGSHDSR